MKKTILSLGLTLVCAVFSYSQEADARSSGKGQASVSADKSNDVNIQSGTRLEAQLQNSLDVKKVKVGDQVILKTSHAIKSNGRTVVDKGARLIGHVTEVKQKTKSEDESRIGIVFDRLEKGSLAFPISATITSITRGRASTRVDNNDLFETSSAHANTSARSTGGGQSSGLLGTVANTTGAALGTTTSVAGNVAGGADAAVGTTVDSTANAGNTAAGPLRSLGRMRISESSSSSAEGGAMLSLQGENLRVEKGTTFNVVIYQSASAGTPNR